jgi:hypothetical protein
MGALSERDIDFARRISAVARELGLELDPSQVQAVGTVAGGEQPLSRRTSVSGLLRLDSEGPQCARQPVP